MMHPTFSDAADLDNGNMWLNHYPEIPLQIAWNPPMQSSLGFHANAPTMTLKGCYNTLHEPLKLTINLQKAENFQEAQAR